MAPDPSAPGGALPSPTAAPGDDRRAAHRVDRRAPTAARVEFPVAQTASTATIEFPVYLPGQAIDEYGYVGTAPGRGIRPRRRSRLQRVLIGLSGGTLLVILGTLLALGTILSPIGARRAARTLAEQQIRSELDPGERVVGRAYVSQRNWWDNFRESYGMLVATDRRLLFVGVPPAPWLGRALDGPPELRVQSFPYDVPFVATSRRLLLGLTRGVVIETPGGEVPFLVARGEDERVREIEHVVERAQIASTESAQREQAGRIAPPPPAPVYGYHTVRSGEAVSTLARRYGTTPDVIRQLNRLTSDAIRIGQRLRVPLPAGVPRDSGAPAGPAAGGPAQSAF